MREKLIGDVELIRQGQHPASGLRWGRLALIPGERRPGRRVSAGGEDVSQDVRAQTPMLADQAQDMVADLCTGDITTPDPPAIKDEP